MASCYIRPLKSMDCQKWARWQYHPGWWYCHLAHFWQSLDFGGLIWHDVITSRTFKYSSGQNLTRRVHIRSHKLVWTCLLSYLWTSSEKGPPKMGVDTDSMGGRHSYAKWPILIKNVKLFKNSTVLNSSGSVLFRTGLNSWLSGGIITNEPSKVAFYQQNLDTGL